MNLQREISSYYCTKCRRTTKQTRVVPDDQWICRVCGCILHPPGEQARKCLAPSTVDKGREIQIMLGKEPAEVVKGRLLETHCAKTDATAGNRTIGADEILGGLSLRDPAGSGRTDTTDTAANIKTALGQAGAELKVGSVLIFAVCNNADAAETITIAGGTGVTAKGQAAHMQIAQNTSGSFALVCTNASTPTFDLYRI